jgi:hypothetical protein
MSAASIPDLKRIHFFSGQRLTAQDMTDIQTASRELRWLHNRSLHGWGIGSGYGVTGEAGDTIITISPGYAVDCVGRELILTESVTIPVPAVAGVPSGSKVIPATFFLTITYLGDIGQSTLEGRPGVCLPAGTVRLTERPLIQWLQLKDIQEGINVILAEAAILNCQLNSALGLDVRRSARPAEQPYINAGQVPPAAITWVPVPGGSLITHVDTSAAKFASAPAYFAHVMGSRTIELGSPPEFPDTHRLVTVSLIENPAPDGFNIQVVLLMFNGSNQVVAVPDGDLTKLLPHLEWTIAWMGIEG